MRRPALIIGMVITSLLILFGAPALYRIPSGAYRFDPVVEVVPPSGPAFAADRHWYLGSVRNRDYAPGRYAATLVMDLTEEQAASPEQRFLVVPYISGTALAVFLNGRFLGAQGDTAAGNSNIWHSAKRFSLPPGILARRNTLVIELQGPYEAGLPMEPYILDGRSHAAYLLLLEFFSDKVVWFLSGAIFIMGCALILIGSASLPRIDSRTLIGAAALVTAAFLADFMTFEVLPLPLVEFKRLMVIARHLAALLFPLGYLALLERKTDLFARLFAVVQGLAVLALLFPRDMIALKNLYTYTFLTMGPLPLYLLYHMFRTRGDRPSHTLLLTGVWVAACAALRDALIPLLYPGSVYVSHYGFMVMIISATGFIVMDVVHHYRQLLAERLRADRCRLESLRDPLTGTYNRNMLELEREILQGPFSLLFLDLDNFKAINDTHGHAAGDRVLAETARLMLSVLRRDDVVVRTGGDEFLAILPNCPRRKALDLAAQIEAAVASASVAAEGCAGLRFGASIGTAAREGPGPVDRQTFAELLAAADGDMYARKERTKRGGL